MKFPTQYDPNSFELSVSNPGTSIHTIFSPRYTDDGHMYLEKTGEEDIYDQIQSHAESCDIYSILRRFANGDVAVLSKVQGTYGDFTQVPKTYAEMLNALNTAEAEFMRLPLDVRAKFDHSFEHWLSSMDSLDFAEKMGFAQPPSPFNNNESVDVGAAEQFPSSAEKGVAKE